MLKNLSLRPRRRGMTLPELLIVLFIVTLITGVIISVYVASTRVWRRVSSQSKAFPEAYVVLNSIASDVRNSAYIIVPSAPAAWATGKAYVIGNQIVYNDVTYKCIQNHTSATTNAPDATTGSQFWGPTNAWVVVYRPVVDNTRSIGGTYLNRIPLRADLNNAIRYFISDKTGAENTAGTCLWRKTFTQNASGTITSIAENKKLADNVTGLSFVEDAASVGAVSRTLAITAVAVTFTGTEKKTTYQSSFVTYIAYQNPPPDTAVVTPVF